MLAVVRSSAWRHARHLRQGEDAPQAVQGATPTVAAVLVFLPPPPLPRAVNGAAVEWGRTSTPSRPPRPTLPSPPYEPARPPARIIEIRSPKDVLLFRPCLCSPSDMILWERQK